MTATTRSERAFMFTTTNRMHATYDKSSGEANAKVRLADGCNVCMHYR
jgi:hypothetical protein